ncbi:hydratase [Candidatus Cetobacterium colombiensis]|uniref:Hydratase n=1 Tax=Candidatus Cetobacterium colombiensis TaxID=3073100 RepID=A0ABU4W641_9FUSO|nr:hydratase [Candidatus Cetobacterium colombiensis]MDX8334993.1 hydratase [Candidatus Cetobacterium colombiensis]
MITLKNGPIWLQNNQEIIETVENISVEQGKKNTIAYSILESHNSSDVEGTLKLTFDSLTSHDLTYVGVIQTAKASGLKEFPVPYVLTNCHNSLCAVGGTINDDDHLFGLTAAKKYGGIYVPPHQAVIHQYMREVMAGCGKMILGTDSHTRYGALGTMGIGEGGGEVVKQLLKNTYDISTPKVIAVYLEGTPKKGIGPQDVALAMIGKVFKNGFVKNTILEFVGPGIENLSIDFRNGIDIMTTETTCLSSIWATDEKVREYFKIHGREEVYAKLTPGELACYDGLVHIDLNKVESMIALPFHPSNVYTIKELNENPQKILAAVEEEIRKQMDNPEITINLQDKIVDGKIKVDQAEIAGCAGGTYENMFDVAEILKGCSLTDDYFTLNVYPASMPIYSQMMDDGSAKSLLQAGAVIKTAFCGPCFGAGDVPANQSFSIRHTTRNFPNREGSKPNEGQIAYVALMDARSIAATALNGGFLTPATDLLEEIESDVEYKFDASPYTRVYNGFEKANEDEIVKLGPNIADWPEMIELQEDILLKVASVIADSVTTTDELIPSGDAASLRSNPKKMSDYTLSRRDPAYVPVAKEIQKLEEERQAIVKGNQVELSEELNALIDKVLENVDSTKENFIKNTEFGSVIYAVKPGDGSAREQAASCQKVLGGLANISVEYATKRYKSNLINWGMIPFTASPEIINELDRNDYIYIEGIRKKLEENATTINALLIKENTVKTIELKVEDVSKEDKEIILNGSLINFYASQNK